MFVASHLKKASMSAFAGVRVGNRSLQTKHRTFLVNFSGKYPKAIFLGNNGYPLKNIKNIILSKKSHTTATIYPPSSAKKNMLYNFPRRVYTL